MKKIFSIMMLVLLSMSIHAQTNPNRLLVRDKQGNVKGYLAERIDSIYFARQEGRVAADINFKSYDPDLATVSLDVKRTPGCVAFRIDCLPTVRMSYLKDDAAIANYFDNRGGQLYYEDFENGEMSGFEFEFKDNSNYSLISVGYDEFGVACSASRADFTTPRKEIVGSPNVEWTVTEKSQTTLSLKFTPNSDAKQYGICLFKKGEAQAQFDMFAPMFGFVNMSEMILSFSGKLHSGVYENTWKDLAPNTEYEIYIQPLDANGTCADMVIAEAVTDVLGGTGAAEVSISIGEFGGDAEYGYYQWITFTPNDQVALYRGMLIEKAAFESPDWGEANLIEYLKTDNPMDPYWDMYETNEDRWNIEPNKEYIAFAMGKNANGEWGKLTRVDFKTPASAPAAAKAQSVCKRMEKKNVISYKQQGLNLKGLPRVKKAGLKLEKGLK